ncbi:nuclear apoptosis-inducing factor 1-like [Haliotis asinina]|uniref:nuclear apoptosis-inducing factor 1-like n=1 Tax=Haliotis asinina TaxID=109174 RepID=UPI003531A8E3
MAETDASKKRKPNWHKEECLLLAELVKERKTVIEGRFGPGVTSANRHEAWQKITDTLNANGHQQRSKEEVIKKWKNLKSAGKSAYSTFKNSTTATGGGPPPTPISPVTEAVVDCIGRDNTVLTGIGPMSMDSSFIQLLQLNQSFEKELEPSLASPSTSASACTSVSTSATSSAVLEKEKLLLEIEVLKLQKIYLQSKIRKLEE